MVVGQVFPILGQIDIFNFSCEPLVIVPGYTVEMVEKRVQEVFSEGIEIVKHGDEMLKEEEQILTFSDSNITCSQDEISFDVIDIEVGKEDLEISADEFKLIRTQTYDNNEIDEEMWREAENYAIEKCLNEETKADGLETLNCDDVCTPIPPMITIPPPIAPLCKASSSDESSEDDSYSLDNLDERMNSSSDGKTYFGCSLCNFMTSHKHSLQRHIINKHEVLQDLLPCPRSFCSQTFSTRWEKEEHVAQCWLSCQSQREECQGKVFIRPDKFQQHLRMHKRMDETNEKYKLDTLKN